MRKATYIRCTFMRQIPLCVGSAALFLLDALLCDPSVIAKCAVLLDQLLAMIPSQQDSIEDTYIWEDHLWD